MTKQQEQQEENDNIFCIIVFIFLFINLLGAFIYSDIKIEKNKEFWYNQGVYDTMHIYNTYYNCSRNNALLIEQAPTPFEDESFHFKIGKVKI